MRALVTLLLLLAGCEGLLPMGDTGATEVPDTETESDTDTDGDTDTDTDTDTDSDTDTLPTLTPPQVSALTATPMGTTSIRLQFTMTDADDDLDGGTLSVTVNGTITTFAIPSQLAQYNPSNGVTRVDVAAPSGATACNTVTANISVQATDATGLRSPNATTSAQIGTGGAGTITTTENGDDYLAPYDLGSVAKGSTITGTLASTGNDGTSAYTGDLDFFVFTPCTTGSWTFTLSWANSADYDFALYDAGWTTNIAYAESLANPEVMTATLTAGTTYNLRVAGWSGPTGAYTVTTQ